MNGYFNYCVPKFSDGDRAMLERVLIRHCIGQDVALSSFEASDAAVALVELFRHGVHNEHQLGKVIGPRISYLRYLSRQPSRPMQAARPSNRMPQQNALSRDLPTNRKDPGSVSEVTIMCNRCDVAVQIDRRNNKVS